MARTSSKVKSGELKRLLRAVVDAGFKVARIDIRDNGSIAMLTTDASPALAGNDVDSLDKELAEFESRKHGHD